MTSIEITTVAILIAATLSGLWRGARLSTRRWVLWMQVPVALLFFWLLYPPAVTVRGDSLNVYTNGDDAPLAVALPSALSARENVPDLATALRRHPGVRHLHVVGEGLSTRDREAAAELAIDYSPPPAHGLIDLQLQDEVLLGHEWSLKGTASGATRVELRDPSGAVADSRTLDAGGGFVLTSVARALGPSRFELRVLDSKQAVIEFASVPVRVRSGETLRLIMRAGAANPEFKYLRRWATDAGMNVSVSADLSKGVALRDGSTQLTPDELARADLVMLDARAWAALAPAEKTALRDAVDSGLGLLLRADGPLDADTAQEWRAWGYGTTAGSVTSTTSDAASGATSAAAASRAATRTVTLDQRIGTHERMTFGLAPVDVDAGHAEVMLRADDGTAVAWWRTQGSGRVALWLLLDSFKLVLSGEPARYASLWSDSIDLISRPRPAAAAAPRLPQLSWVDERVTLCGLGDAAAARSANGETAALVIDADGCAAYWPPSAGWSVLQTRGEDHAFFVRASDDGAGLRRARDRDATLSLASSSTAPASTLEIKMPLPRWLLFAAWLLAASSLWWCERIDTGAHP